MPRIPIATQQVQQTVTPTGETGQLTLHKDLTNSGAELLKSAGELAGAIKKANDDADDTLATKLLVDYEAEAANRLTEVRARRGLNASGAAEEASAAMEGSDSKKQIYEAMAGLGEKARAKLYNGFRRIEIRTGSHASGHENAEVYGARVSMGQDRVANARKNIKTATSINSAAESAVELLRRKQELAEVEGEVGKDFKVMAAEDIGNEVKQLISKTAGDKDFTGAIAFADDFPKAFDRAARTPDALGETDSGVKGFGKLLKKEIGDMKLGRIRLYAEAQKTIQKWDAQGLSYEKGLANAHKMKDLSVGKIVADMYRQRSNDAERAEKRRAERFLNEASQRAVGLAQEGLPITMRGVFPNGVPPGVSGDDQMTLLGKLQKFERDSVGKSARILQKKVWARSNLPSLVVELTNPKTRARMQLKYGQEGLEELDKIAAKPPKPPKGASYTRGALNAAIEDKARATFPVGAGLSEKQYENIEHNLRVKLNDFQNRYFEKFGQNPTKREMDGMIESELSDFRYYKDNKVGGWGATKNFANDVLNSIIGWEPFERTPKLVDPTTRPSLMKEGKALIEGQATPGGQATATEEDRVLILNKAGEYGIKASRARNLSSADKAELSRLIRAGNSAEIRKFAKDKGLL